MKARYASVETIYNNTPITANTESETESFSYADEGSAKSDSIQLTLSCIDEKWLNGWMPKKGATLTSTIKVQDWNGEGDNRAFACGCFLLDDLSFSGNPRTMQIGAVSAPTDESFAATKRTQTWQGAGIRQIGETIAGRSGLALYYDAPEIGIELAEQNDTDAAFYANLCENYGLCLKVYNNRLVVFDREAYKAKPAVAVVDAANMKKWDWNTTIAGTYTGGSLDYTDNKKDADIHVAIGGGSRTLKLNQAASSVADGAIQLAAALNKNNHGMTKLSFSTMGTPGLVAGQCIAITGLGAVNGKYYLDRVTHSITGQGYVCSYEASLVTGSFSAGDASGTITYNPVADDTYADYKSTYETSGATEAKGATAAKGGGAAISLSNCPLYYTSVAKKRSNTVSGTYYLYDGILIAGRYRITNLASRCGKTPIGTYVTGWIDAAYVK
jgi:phage protein D